MGASARSMIETAGNGIEKGTTMSTKTKTLAKSLHTVTALVQVARLHETHGVGSNLLDPDAARERQIDSAMATLGYAGASDPYGLRGKALKALTAGNGNGREA